MNDYYVYVYIDPRNYEEFYYGKGKGSRKNAHLSEESDTEKTRRIEAIKREGLEPIVRVIARGLTSAEALLVEKTLLWKLGKQLTNISSGHYAQNFRPHDLLYREISGFDFNNAFYYFNVGEGDTRTWRDCLKFGFVSAGQDPKYSAAVKRLEVGDVIAAYVNRRGYVGVGKITHKALPVSEVTINGVPLLQLDLTSDLGRNAGNQNSEYVARVDWLRSLPKESAKWKKNSGLFYTQQIAASLDRQEKTREFIEKEFDIDISDLIV